MGLASAVHGVCAAGCALAGWSTGGWLCSAVAMLLIAGAAALSPANWRQWRRWGIWRWSYRRLASYGGTALAAEGVLFMLVALAFDGGIRVELWSLNMILVGVAVRLLASRSAKAPG